MCCECKGVSMHRGADKKASAIRFIAMALLACLISVTVLSGLFLVTQTNHEHDHNGPAGTCATCAHIATTENILKQLSAALAVAGIAVGGSFALISHLKAIFSEPVSFTPVLLNVRQNN